MRVLLVEDDPSTQKSVKMMLESANMVVDTTDMGEDGLEIGKLYDYDIIVLDIMLPDMDGFEVLRRLRDSRVNTPVLILSGLGESESKVKGLGSGADDYLLKPFEMEELIARIRALLRRPGGVLGLVMTAGNVSFDTTAREVRIDDQPISISRREMGVLEQLMRRYGRVVPKSVLEDKIYGFDEEVSSNSVEVHVSRLRKRLSKNGASVSVHTLRGVGYLLSEGALNN